MGIFHAADIGVHENASAQYKLHNIWLQWPILRDILVNQSTQYIPHSVKKCFWNVSAKQQQKIRLAKSCDVVKTISI